jgi:hypothetical protein
VRGPNAANAGEAIRQAVLGIDSDLPVASVRTMQEVVDRSIDGSLCFGLYRGQKQLGFARVITDYATFAYLADVFVVETSWS